MLTKILFLTRKDKKHKKRKLDCKFIRTNLNKENYDVFYEIGKTQRFIIEFKNKRLNELEEEIRQLKQKTNL